MVLSETRVFTPCGRVTSTQACIIDRRDPEAAAHQHHVPGALDVLRLPERSDEVEEGVALRVLVAHLPRALSQRLDHHGDGAALRVHVGHGERDALGVLMQPKHHEVAGPGGARRETAAPGPATFAPP